MFPFVVSTRATRFANPSYPHLTLTDSFADIHETHSPAFSDGCAALSIFTHGLASLYDSWHQLRSKFHQFFLNRYVSTEITVKSCIHRNIRVSECRNATIKNTAIAEGIAKISGVSASNVNQRYGSEIQHNKH